MYAGLLGDDGRIPLAFCVTPETAVAPKPRETD